jgi:hypothetical protein
LDEHHHDGDNEAGGGNRCAGETPGRHHVERPSTLIGGELNSPFFACCEHALELSLSWPDHCRSYRRSDTPTGETDPGIREMDVLAVLREKQATA